MMSSSRSPTVMMLVLIAANALYAESGQDVSKKEPLKLSMDFAGKSLKEVAEQLSAAAGCAIKIVKDEDRRLIVNFNAENMTCREMLAAFRRNMA